MRLHWLSRLSYSVAAVKLNLSVMAAVFVIYGLSLIFQPHRWASTPAYHVLLQIFGAPVWGGLFLGSGVAMGLAVWQFGRRWAVVASLMAAFTLTTGWMLAFVVRYLTSPDTTPQTWVSWAVFDFLLLKVLVSLDRPHRLAALPDSEEIAAFRQAIDDALTSAADDQKAALVVASDRLHDKVSVACANYAQALHAVVPAGAMPAGDPARTALEEARNALLRAEEAYARATGLPVPVHPAQPGDMP